jgi:hypothetical protein
MSARSSAAAVTAANTVDNELIAYTADSKTYAQNTGLEFWIACEKNFLFWLLLPKTCYQPPHPRHKFNVCSQYAGI